VPPSVHASEGFQGIELEDSKSALFAFKNVVAYGLIAKKPFPPHNQTKEEVECFVSFLFSLQKFYDLFCPFFKMFDYWNFV